MTSVELNKEDVSNDLQRIVDNFNAEMGKWMIDSGCRANFQWLYGLDRNVKSMEIQSIDLIVYRKPAPKFEQLKEAMGSPS